MREMAGRLATDPALAAAYRAAHERYLGAARAARARSPQIAGISAGGMPDRVKCLHVLVAHSLAAGPGVNPLGDEALDDAGRRGAIAPGGAWGGVAPRLPVGAGTTTSSGRSPGGGDRLRHQLDPAADRRRRLRVGAAARRASARC